MTAHPTPIISGLGFAEAPRWHDGRLWLVDYLSGLVLRSDLDGRCETVTHVEGVPGGLGFLPDGTPLVVSQRDFRVLRIRSDGSLDLHADLSAHAVGAANEMFVDSAGRAYVGHHGFDFFGGAEPRPSTLLMVTPEGQVREVADNLVFPNGMALLADGHTLIVAESFASRLTAFTVSADGTLSSRRVWADLPGHTPDGICADREGAVWAGSPLSGTFLRVARGGTVLERIETTGGRWAVACAFAGEDLELLCCLSAATTMDGMPRGESDAFVELVPVAVPGISAP